MYRAKLLIWTFLQQQKGYIPTVNARARCTKVITYMTDRKERHHEALSLSPPYLSEAVGSCWKEQGAELTKNLHREHNNKPEARRMKDKRK